MKSTGSWICGVAIGLALIGGCGEDDSSPQPQSPPTPTTPPPTPTATTDDRAGDVPLTRKGPSHGPQDQQ